MNLEDFFSATTLSRAHDIVRRKLVILDEHSDESTGFLSGLVLGTAPLPYSVEVYFDSDYVSSECSCPIGEDCKHGAALMLTWLNSQDPSPGSQRRKASHDRRQQLAAAVANDREVMRWVENLVQALDSESNQKARGIEFAGNVANLLYALQPVEGPAGPTLAVNVLERTRLKNGEWSNESAHSIEGQYGFHDGDTSHEDEAILELLRTTMRRRGHISSGVGKGAALLLGTLGDYLLTRMLDTGRLYWDEERDFACTAGPLKNATIQWTSADDTDTTLKISTNLHEDGLLFLADTRPVRYVDPRRFEVGIIESTYTLAVLHAVTQAPEFPASAAVSLSNLLGAELDEHSLPLPAEPSLIFVNEPLVCRLRVYSADGSAHVRQWTVRVMMCYGVHEFHVELQPGSSTSSVTLEDGREFEIKRDHDNEYRQYQFFRRRVSGFEPVYARDPQRFSIADHQPLSRSDEERYHAFERLFDAFDTLRAEGFDIVVEAPVSLEAATVTDFDFNIQATDNGWFDLALQVKHEGTSYNLLPLILNWLEHGNRESPLTVISNDGRRLSVPADMIKPVANTLLELYDDSKGQVAVTRARALGLSKLTTELAEAGAQSEWQGDKALLALTHKIERISGDLELLLASAKAPRTLKAELRPYQLTGMAWLNFLHDAGLCGVLADDMGLGKTIQTLAHILSLKQRRKLKGPCLVVAPTSVLHNWAREAERFAPSLKVHVWHGQDRHENPLAQSNALLVVTSYALALRDHELLSKQDYALLILDEAQTIKNPAAKITQSLKRLPVDQRICLTGTPLENHLGELWSLFDFLMPGLLGAQKRFSQHFRTPIEKHGDAERQQRLNNAIAPFLLRRRKQSVATELPAKTEIIVKIELDSEQAKFYETIRIGMEKRVRKLLQDQGVAKSHIQMLDALLKLRQSCCHPDLVKLDSARRVKSSAKTDHVLSMIDELVNEGRTIILFSQFTQMLDILARELGNRGIDFVKLTGKTRKRQEAIDAFQSGQVPLFLISLKAGGTGLNLTAADTVIHYDPWWNPAVENQATDRAHRIGQEKPVFVYKLIADNTVEDKIVAMQARKQALADATVERGDANPVKSLSADDILALFAEG